MLWLCDPTYTGNVFPTFCRAGVRFWGGLVSTSAGQQLAQAERPWGEQPVPPPFLKAWPKTFPSATEPFNLLQTWAEVCSPLVAIQKTPLRVPQPGSFPSEPVISLGFAPFLPRPSISAAVKWECIPRPQQELALLLGKRQSVPSPQPGEWVFSTPTILKHILCCSAEEPWIPGTSGGLFPEQLLQEPLSIQGLFASTSLGFSFLLLRSS